MEENKGFYKIEEYSDEDFEEETFEPEEQLYENDDEDFDEVKIDKDKKESSLKSTDELIAKNLTDAFLILSSMLDEAKIAKENIEKTYRILEKIAQVTENLKESAEKFNEINQIVEHMDILVKAISINNSNIKELIEITGELNKRQKNMQNELEEIKTDTFVSGKSEESGNRNQSAGNNLAYLNTFLILTLMTLFFIKSFLMQ